MSEKYKFFKDGLFFITMTVVGWIDIFSRKDYVDVIVASLNFCTESKGLQVHEYCIMSNHIHMICSAKNGDVGKIIKDFKSFTAKEILRMVQENEDESRRDWLLHMYRFYARRHSPKSEFQFWIHRNHPIYLYSNYFIEQKSRYIILNPVRAGIVAEPEHYLHSSANPECPVKLCI